VYFFGDMFNITKIHNTGTLSNQILSFIYSNNNVLKFKVDSTMIEALNNSSKLDIHYLRTRYPNISNSVPSSLYNIEDAKNAHNIANIIYKLICGLIEGSDSKQLVEMIIS
jgi:HEPN domain-containing protein